MERLLLKAMCRDSTLRGAALAALTGCRFADPGHQVVFEALAVLPDLPQEHLREHLQRKLAIAGFPALDLGDYFD